VKNLWRISNASILDATERTPKGPDLMAHMVVEGVDHGNYRCSTLEPEMALFTNLDCTSFATVEAGLEENRITEATGSLAALG